MLIRSENRLILRISPMSPVTVNQLETFLNHVKKTKRHLIKTESSGDTVLLSMHELSSDYVADFNKIAGDIDLNTIIGRANG